MELNVPDMRDAQGREPVHKINTPVHELRGNKDEEYQRADDDRQKDVIVPGHENKKRDGQNLASQGFNHTKKIKASPGRQNRHKAREPA